MKIRHLERYKKWSAIIADWESTGLAVAEYCRRNDIARGLFFDWKRRIREREDEARDGDFVAVEFLAESGCCGIGVRIGGDIELQLSKGFDESELFRAIQVLRKAGC